MAVAAERLVRAAITILVISIAMFALLFLGPNPLEMLRESPDITDADIARVTARYGWDSPATDQYKAWAGGFIRGDWGESVRTGRPAREMIMERMPLTLVLMVSAQLLSVVIAIPLGAWLALRRGTRTDTGFAVGSFALMATPGFLIALLLQLAVLKFSHSTGHLVLTTSGAPADGGGVLEWVRRLALPVVTLSLVQVAAWSRYQRAELIGVLDSDFIRCTRAKGIPGRLVNMRHAMPNTMLPIVTLLAMDMAGLFGGAVIVETIFNLPGVGSLLLESVGRRDVVVSLDIVMIAAALTVGANAAVDLAYGVIDPRARSAA